MGYLTWTLAAETFFRYHWGDPGRKRKSVDIFKRACYNTPCAEESAAEYGGIAQLGERLNGIQEVSGSIPLISTKKH